MSVPVPTLAVAPERGAGDSPLSDAEIRRFREDTPGTAGRVHLNNAGASLPPSPVTEAVLDYLRREAEIGGYEASDEAAERLAAVYGDVAALLGAEPRNVAIVENATVAFSQALSAIPFRPGDRLVTTESDYPSNLIQYAALVERCGIEVRKAADLPGGGVDPQAVAELARDPRCRLVAVSWVPTSSGLVQAVEEVGEVCAAAGVPYLIDACQAVGQLPVDVSRLRCDYLAATARKFLRGPRGIGFLYVADGALARGDYPLGIDMSGATLKPDGGLDLVPTARRFENWEFAYALVLGLGEAARYARAAGIERTGQRAIALADHLRRRLAELPGVVIADRGERLCAIVTADIGDIGGRPGRDARQVVLALRRQGINVHAVSAPLGPAGAARQVLRISPHYYNTPEELDRAFAALREQLADGHRG
jgi:selenocysteine lyase/cysteine desulfurase